jgi:S-DNA-T family DNA segregation ATPase FtsK/SpoIIIE
MWDDFPRERAVGHGIAWMVRHPRLLGAVAAMAAAVWMSTVATAGSVALAVLAVALLVWELVHSPRREVAFAGELAPAPSPIIETLGRPRAWPPPALDPAGLSHVTVGKTATGEPWQLSVVGTHILIAGVSGAGKSSVIWSLLEGLGPFVQCGLVEVWAIDPKGGQELTIGADLFARYEYRDWPGMAKLLNGAVAAMKERQSRLVGVTRKHVPTVAEPLVVVLVDEMTVLAEIPEAKVRNEIKAALFILLAQGRAAGFVVVGAGQDIRKERLPDRPMFATTIALRMERIQVDMLLGDGARERGALCDQIPRELPGTGYVMVDGGEPVRVRSYWLPDEDVRRIAALYGRAS